MSLSMTAFERTAAVRPVLFGSLLLLSLVCGCNLFSTTCKEDERGCLGGGYGRTGDACARTGDCGEGLTCTEGLCQFAASTARGAACKATAECRSGLYCSATSLECEPIAQDPAGEGEPCGSTADCEKGLACDVDVSTLFTEGPFGLLSDECAAAVDTSAVPDSCKLPTKCVARGDGDLGTKCKKDLDCLAGLYCVDDPLTDAVDPICFASPSPLPVEPLSIPTWSGADCSEDASDPTAYFEVPRESGEHADFYRLPFPNDIRKRGGKIDLSDHPVPPSELGVPVVERFVQAAGESIDGFSTNPVIFFRFSTPYDTDSKTSLTGTSLRIVDITPGSPTYNAPASIEWSPSGVDSNYICPNWIGLRRPIGQPLRPATTYASIITRAVRAKDGKSYARSADLDALLSGGPPADSTLASAYQTYAPLRAWLADTQQDPAAILNAAVFTTQSPEAIMPKLRAAVLSAGTPQVKDMVVCDTGVTSPCLDDEGRGACNAKSAAFTEIHGRITLPIFQAGTPPYEKPEQGGEIALDGAGNVIAQSPMDVCFALSVPATAAPGSGYPVLIYGHGTGGSFAGQTGAAGLAERAATAAAPTALLAIDLPEHGARRGDSKRPPEDLVFNVLNPHAARGNFLQGAADLMSLARFVKQGGVDAAASPTGSAIRLDASRVAVFGHSQGATHAALMFGYEPDIGAVVLSGVGGHLVSSMLAKQKPVDIGSIVPFVLFDADDEGKLAGGSYHPVLQIIQTFFDSADPINFGHRAHRDPTAEAPTGHHLFMTYGLRDTYSPERTQEAFALSARLDLVSPKLTAIDLPEVAPSLKGNVTIGDTPRTVGVRQYDPMGAVDGHFVASGTQQGSADVQRFLSQFFAGEAPEIGALP